METSDTLILGAGLAGLSASYHNGHKNCLILEKNAYPFGHIHSEVSNGFTWDEGPHVSFTDSEYVRELFAENVNGKFEEYEVTTGNYYQGHWIDHPAQSNLYQVPEPLRSKCLNSFLESREWAEAAAAPQNYQEWLYQAFGPVFADTFPAAYTRKYWTCEPKELRTEWVGSRVFKPSVADVIAGSKGPLDRQTHYIKKIRYPSKGGYQSFAKKLAQGARIHLRKTVARIDLQGKKIWTSDGKSYAFKRLINTIPLPIFVRLCSAPEEVLRAAEGLSCSQLLLVNLMVNHPTVRKENWMYVYDENKFSTRINCTELLSPNNAPVGQTGIQVEVYHSRHRSLQLDREVIMNNVISECREMGLIEANETKINTMIRNVPWANIIYTHETPDHLDHILSWLAAYGLERESDDLEPLTDWQHKKRLPGGELMLAGRFGQWKYYWTDDCVLRGKFL